jgi:Immunity protein Imm1
MPNVRLVLLAARGRVDAVPKAVWYDPDRELPTHAALDPHRPVVRDVMAMVVSLRSAGGHPAVEFVRDDGALLSIATDGTRALRMWTNSIGETFHSVGPDEPGPLLVFDYFGSWSEAPANHLVALQDAVSSAETFLRVGIPDTQSVIFTPE